MWYNYVRFDNPFDFGAGYQLTVVNISALGSRIFALPMGIFVNIFMPPTIMLTFPYLASRNDLSIFYGYYYMENMIAGALFVCPICMYIFKIIKANKVSDSKECKIIINSLTIVGLIIAIVSIYMAGSNQRYLIDYIWMFIFAGIMIFLSIYHSCKSKEVKKIMQKLLCYITIYTIFIGTASGIISEKEYMKSKSSAVYYNTRYSICFWE